MQHRPWVEVVAIASRDLSKAKAAAAELNIPRTYGSYEELLNDPSVEYLQFASPITSMFR